MIDRNTLRKEWREGRLLTPLVTIYESKEEFTLVAQMPGVNKNDLEIKLTQGHLAIYGKVANPSPDCECALVREIEEGNYYRVFQVSDSLDGNKIKARLEDGVLRIVLPKHERIKPREIPIELG